MGATDKIKEKKDKSEKKDKKEKKMSEEAGVKKEKKDKKEKKEKTEKLAKAVEAHLEKEGSVDPEDVVKTAEDLVPFALPLADDKTHKKTYKLIKKGAKLKSIHRGVKECEKAIKKCPLRTAASPPADAPGLVIIAGDISPMDVIMHFPILCEEHGVPYLYIRSRADLGVAACTKRATSVVMLKPEGKKSSSSGKEEAGDDKKVDPAEYLEAYKELVKTAQKQWNVQVEPWVKGTHPLQIEAKVKGTA
ncbi:50S ribosomal protein L30e-like protein [Neurospora hispaniola]|uniref:50S ribosomal protein L30e-like protein n=1 Tax=Neurospora hispaniola TaxID=588809 RepID=A0AAJ0MW07_9PEZI|nr:50S ribosomal protein L30e-like protein [Neurospora hispaniola]